MTPREALAAAAAQLAAAGVELPGLEARLFLAEALNARGSSLYALPDVPLTEQQAARAAAMVTRRLRGEPVAYILGCKEFWSLEFRVTKDVLIPRPDSETIVQAALDHSPRTGPLRVLDLGTGSGCLLLAFLSERPEAAGVGVDISEASLAVAASNADALALSARARFQMGDWTEGLEGPFDVVLCNPPYIPAGELAGLAPDVRDYEPRMALSPGVDGLSAYARIAAQLPAILAPSGVAIVEAGQGAAEGVVAHMRAQALEIVEIRPDIQGIGRAVVIRPQKTL